MVFFVLLWTLIVLHEYQLDCPFRSFFINSLLRFLISCWVLRIVLWQCDHFLGYRDHYLLEKAFRLSWIQIAYLLSYARAYVLSYTLFM